MTTPSDTAADQQYDGDGYPIIPTVLVDRPPSWRCRIGWHSFPMPTLTPDPSGLPMASYVARCRRCPAERRGL